MGKGCVVYLVMSREATRSREGGEREGGEGGRREGGEREERGRREVLAASKLI